MKLRLLACLSLCALLAGGLWSLPGCSNSSEAQTKRIVILTNGDDPFWDPCEAGAMAAAEDLKLADAGYTVSFERADFSVKGQVDKLKQYALATDIVAVGISVYDNTSPAIAEAIQKLKDQGVKVVTIDGDVDRDQFRDVRYGYLGTDNIIGGRLLGAATLALRPEDGKYAFFVGNKGNANAKDRMQGFIEGSQNRFTEVIRIDDGGKREVARKNVRDVVGQHPQVNTLVGIWAYNGPAAVQVVTENNTRDDYTLVTFDADEASIKAMEEGNLDVMVVQDPFNMGYEGVRVLKALVEDDEKTLKEYFPNHGQPDGDLFRTGLKVVIPDENSPLESKAWFDELLKKHPEIKELVDEEKVEFPKLNEFKQWLKKYNLKSS